MKYQKTIKSNLVDIVKRRIYPAHVEIVGDKIASIKEVEESFSTYIMPGFIDAHIHIESSLLVPSEFARMAVVHGTVATVSDPHEIANVLGLKGVEYMIQNGKDVPFHFFFGASPCVPATSFETAGDKLDVSDVERLLQMPEIKYLSEMMNWPGVLHKDQDVMDKIALAKKYNKPVDGHAPGLKGEQAREYIAAGISTDHECFTAEEALGKLDLGMKVQIREGSAARNFEALYPLITQHSNQMMFCSDDKHPDDLKIDHINGLVKRAVEKGMDVFDVLQMACINPIEHYNLEVGQLCVGDQADLIEVNNLTDFNVLATWVKGQKVAEKGESFIKSVPIKPVNNFHIKPISLEEIQVNATSIKVNLIEVLDGELVTNKSIGQPNVTEGKWVSNLEGDVLKLVVVNRYNQVQPQVAFIKNFGFKEGAIASSVAHDSHNIIAVGVDDLDILNAINLIIEQEGGLSFANDTDQKVLPLPVAGLMSNLPAEEVTKQYEDLSASAKELGGDLRSPYMSLSFMALLVIPSIKLSDLGLFDGDNFQFVPLAHE